MPINRLLISLLVCWCSVGVFVQRSDKVSAETCDGLGEYREAMFDVAQDYLDAMEADGVPLSRDPLTYSSDEWAAIAENSLEYQRAVKAIQAPEWVLEWHQALIEQIGIAEQLSRSIASDGIVAALVFSDAMDANTAAKNAARTTVAGRCPDFEQFVRDWDALDGEIEGTPAAASPSATPIAFGTAATIGDGWTVQIVSVHEDPTTIDPSADWFLDWLASNPRPDGSEFFTVRFHITNLTGETGSPFDLDVGFTAGSGAEYDSRSNCGNVPDQFRFGDVLHPGDTLEGTVCRLVRNQDRSSLRMYAEPAFSFDPDQRVWFELAS